MINSQTPIAPGARPFLLSGNAVGILIIHGYGGSIGDYRAFGELLNQHGYTVSGMRVAGHGQGESVLGQSDEYDWRESVFTAARELIKLCPTVIIVGTSFGGALAVDYAVHAGQAVRGLVLVNMPFKYRNATAKKMGLRLLRLVTPYFKKAGLSPADTQRYAELGSTTAWPINGLIATQDFITSFVRPALPRLQQPILIMTNASDPYVSGNSAQAMLEVLPPNEKSLVVIPGHTHRPFRDPASVTFMADHVHAFIQATLAKKTK